MKRHPIVHASETDAEVSALIATLHVTGQRLEELTGGEVDTVADREGRTFLLRHAQDQLRHHEADKQAAVLNALPANIALIDASGMIVSVNAAWRLFADANVLHAPGHGVGLNYLAICDSACGDDAAKAHAVAEGIRSVLRRRAKSFGCEYPCHSPTQQRWFLMTVTPLSDERAAGAVIMHLDITERVQADEALGMQRSELRAVFDMMPAMIWFKDTNNRILRVNQQVADAAGLSVAAIEGRPSTEIYPDDAARFYEDDLEVIASRTSKLGIVETLTDAHGAVRWVQTDKVPYFNNEGTVVGVAVMARDVTKQKTAADAVKRSEKHLRDIFDGFGPSMFVALLAPDGVLLEVNHAALEAGGLRQEDVLGKPFHETPWWSASEKMKLQLRDAMALAANGKASRLDVQSHVRGRQVAEWDFCLQPLRDEGGKVAYLVASANDITERKRSELELRESERRYSQMMENVQLASVMLDRKARITYCNEYLLRLTGWRLDEVIGKDWFETFMPIEVGDMRPMFALLLANAPAAWHVENELLTRSGERRLFRWNNSVLRAGTGGVVGSASIGEDITAQKQAEIRIQHLNRVYAVLSGINSLIVHARDRDDLFREACRIAVDSGGFRMSMIAIRDRATGMALPVASAGKDQAIMDAVSALLASNEHAQKTIVARVISDGKTIVSNDSQTDPAILLGAMYAEVGVRSLAALPLIVGDDAVGVLVLYASEVEFFHAQEMKLLTELAGDIAFAIDHIDKGERLNYLASYDPLTGLANQTLFLERLQARLSVPRGGQDRVAVIALDIQRFKAVNDAFGRKAGDDLLRQVADRFVEIGGDATRFARLGPDRFAIVALDVGDIEQVGRYIEQHLDATFGAPFRIADTDLRVSMKLGIALFPDDGKDAETLLRNAEAALKKAKVSGDRYVFFTGAMTTRVAERLVLESRLRKALDNEEFVLHYQPKVNLASGLVTSAEALIRWNDPETGLVPPLQFIPILEETGLIHEVGRWAMRKAITDYLRWRDAGLAAVRIAVNVSPLQLRNRHFIAEVGEALAGDPNAAAGLELEITESLIMEDVEHSKQQLLAIRAMDVTIAIDDFGTGYSSLSYLSKLPVNTLKIDRAFVTEMTTGADGLALVSTIVNLAHSLKLKVVAEGVETDEQSRLLRLLRCDEVQGYFFSKPVPGDVFEAKFLSPMQA